MVSEVIIHIGMHKTGSTSIQASLYGYDDGHAFYARFPEPNHSTAIRGTFSTRPEAYHQWKKLGLDAAGIQHRCVQYRVQLVTELSRDDRDTLIISGEGIGLLDDAGKAKFLQLVRQYVSRVRVVCYIRDPFEFAASYLQQNIKVGRRSCPPVVSTDYRKRLEVFSEQLQPENLIVRAFDRQSFPGGSVVADFCNIAGLDQRRISEKSANESLSAPALKLVYAFNRSNDCYAGDPVIHQARQALARWVQHAYSTGPAIQSAWFASRADLSELAYMHECFGLDLNNNTLEHVDERQDIDEWLLDLNDVDPGPLRNKLRELGVNSAGKSFEWMLNRLYYHHVAEIAVRQRQFRISPETISWGLLRDTSKSFSVAAIRAIRRRIADYFYKHKRME